MASDIHYGPWRIYFDPPPIPVRSMDWHFVHEDFDAWTDDGDWRSNGLSGSAESIEACKAEIADIEEEKGMIPTAEVVAYVAALDAERERERNHEDQPAQWAISRMAARAHRNRDGF